METICIQILWVNECRHCSSITLYQISNSEFKHVAENSHASVECVYLVSHDLGHLDQFRFCLLASEVQKQRKCVRGHERNFNKVINKEAQILN